MSDVQQRAHVKAALEAAAEELKKAVGRVDSADAAGLAELRAGARVSAAFVDFNGSCAGSRLGSAELMKNLRG